MKAQAGPRARGATKQRDARPAPTPVPTTNRDGPSWSLRRPPDVARLAARIRGLGGCGAWSGSCFRWDQEDAGGNENALYATAQLADARGAEAFRHTFGKIGYDSRNSRLSIFCSKSTHRFSSSPIGRTQQARIIASWVTKKYPGSDRKAGSQHAEPATTSQIKAYKTSLSLRTS